MARDVVDGAVTICTCGTMPSVLNVGNHHDTIQGKNAAIVTDHVPIKNILPFGFCKSMANPAVAAACGIPQPCIPITLLKWMPGNRSITTQGERILDDLSICPCIWQGLISVIDPGQTMCTSYVWGEFTNEEGKKERNEKMGNRAVALVRASSKGKNVVAEATAKAEADAAIQKTTAEQEAKLLEDAKENDVVELLYETGTGTVYALTPDELKAFEEEEKNLGEPIGQLNAANNAPIENLDEQEIKARKEKIDQAKKKLQEKLEPLVHGASCEDVSEIVRLRGRKYTYVRSKKMKNHRRSYKMDSEDKKQSIMTGGKIDFKKLKERIKERSSKELNWDLFNYNHSLTSWAEAYNSKEPTSLFGNPKDPNGIFNATADAQILRLSSGATIKGGYNPSMGELSFSADAHGELALAEGKINTRCYIPCKQGWNLKLNENFDLGAIRALFKIGLFGFAGASANICLNLNISADKSGKLKLKGTNSKDPDKQEASAGLFAGVKAGCDASASLAWKSPEKWMEWQDFATESASLDGDLGAGANAALYIMYSDRTGKFLVHTKAGAVCGVGVNGAITLAINAKHIYEFLSYVYHKIKNENFKYIGFLDEKAMEAIACMLVKFAINEVNSIEEAAEKELKGIVKWWKDFKGSLFHDKNLENILKIAKRLNSITSSNDKNIKFMPPEAKGRLLYILTDPKVLDLLELRKSQNTAGAGMAMPFAEADKTQAYDNLHKIENAILVILSYIQSHAEYENVMQHMSLDLKKKVDITVSENILYNELGIYGHSQVKSLEKYKELVDDKRNLVVYPRELAPDTKVNPNKKVLSLRV